METEQNRKDNAESWERWARMRHERGQKGKVFGGIFVLLVGGLLLARQVGVVFPDWLFTWKVLLIAIGFFVGAKHSFRGGGWLIPIVIGGVFLLEDLMPGTSISHFIWPVLIMFLGLLMIFKPRRKWEASHWRQRRWKRRQQFAQAACNHGWTPNPHISPEDRIECNAVFGGIKKNVISKNFKGGEVNSFFGGVEINFMQADIEGTVEIDSTQVFGGAKFIIPPHWRIRSEMTTVFGNIEDNRPRPDDSAKDNDKVLVLNGTCVFGGIEITSY